MFSNNHHFICWKVESKSWLKSRPEIDSPLCWWGSHCWSCSCSTALHLDSRSLHAMCITAGVIKVKRPDHKDIKHHHCSVAKTNPQPSSWRVSFPDRWHTSSITSNVSSHSGRDFRNDQIYRSTGWEETTCSPKAQPHLCRSGVTGMTIIHRAYPHADHILTPV